MSEKRWLRAAIIVLIIFTLNSYDVIDKKVQQEKEFYHDVIKDQGKKIAQQREELKETKEKYKQTLATITENILRNDSFLHIGGSKYNVDYVDKEVYRDILTSAGDYQDLLNKTELFFDKRKEYLTSLPNIWPVQKSRYNRITSEFGDRFDPLTGEQTSTHKGIDIGSTWRAKIVATAEGYVKSHWVFHPRFGRMIILQHDNGYSTVYAHLSKSYVHEGWKVEKGEVIGLMGSSGEASGIHLHYEIRRDGEALDPIYFIKQYISEEERDVSRNTK
jgi:murein DD-endopeptidase MepM/ murein hydrolase activator NlpD